MERFEPEKKLLERGFSVRFSGFTALDFYYRQPVGMIEELISDADIVTLSAIFDPVRFPGEERIDALIPEQGEKTLLVQTQDDRYGPNWVRHVPTWKPLDFTYQPSGRRFYDPWDMYGIIRERGPLSKAAAGHALWQPEYWWYRAADAAVLAARYQWKVDADILKPPEGQRLLCPLGKLEQLALLIRLLESTDPGLGLGMLMNSGFIQEHWPLLAAMRNVSQDKDYHPEGDVWDHTLEMFRHMKNPDLDIAFGILLHDCGKPFSQRSSRNEFDRHAQIGKEKAARFLAELGYGVDRIRNVTFLVGSHMLPAHIPDIPVASVQDVLDDQLFPKLLEIYRCDISSSFRDPSGYYRTCEYYRKYQRYRKNPFRDGQGRPDRNIASLSRRMDEVRRQLQRKDD